MKENKHPSKDVYKKWTRDGGGKEQEKKVPNGIKMLERNGANFLLRHFFYNFLPPVFLLFLFFFSLLPFCSITEFCLNVYSGVHNSNEFTQKRKYRNVALVQHQALFSWHYTEQVLILLQRLKTSLIFNPDFFSWCCDMENLNNCCCGIKSQSRNQFIDHNAFARLISFKFTWVKLDSNSDYSKKNSGKFVFHSL